MHAEHPGLPHTFGPRARWYLEVPRGPAERAWDETCRFHHPPAQRGLGAFLELDVVLREEQHAEEGQAIARALLAELGVAESALVGPAYVELLRQHRGAPVSLR